MTRQVVAHHFCGHINEDMRQCLIYDGPDANARLIGLEYIVTEKLFMTLPDDEKKLWHTHEWEVKGGLLFMPGVPETIQRQDLEKVAKTYGKVYHFWQVDLGHELPIGLPNIMMAVTRDGQLYPEMIEGKSVICVFFLVVLLELKLYVLWMFGWCMQRRRSGLGYL